jgi:hypothetical protein
MLSSCKSEQQPKEPKYTSRWMWCWPSKANINSLIKFERNTRIALHILWVATGAYSLFTSFYRSKLGRPELLLRWSAISVLTYGYRLCQSQ